MPQSGSSGKVPSKAGKIPYELKNQKEWDPDKNKPEYQSDDESNGSYDDDDDVESIHIPYVSGGTFEEDPVHQGPSHDKPSMGVRTNGNAPTRVLENGFQRVTHRKTPRIPTRPRDIPAVQNDIRARISNRGRFSLGFNKDNTARAAYRKRQPHNGTFKLEQDCDKIFPHIRKMYDYLEHLGIRNGSFICPPQHAKDHELLIWGSPGRVQKTLAELREYMLQAGPEAELMKAKKPMAKEKFAKEPSTIGREYKKRQSQMLKQALVQDFQRVPHIERTYGFTGAFLWPVEEVRPEELLGNSLEALDPIRVDYKCHIVFDDKDSAFKVFTDDPESVGKTMLRITGVMKEYTAKFTATNSRRIVDYIIEPPSAFGIRKDIRTLPGPTPDPRTSAGKIPLLTGDILEPVAHDTWLEKSKLMKMQNVQRIEQDLRKAIQLLPYYRGNVRMRIQYGTFELTTLRWPDDTSSMPFENFMMNLALPGTKGRMLRDLQLKKDVGTIMNRVYGANDLFEPLNHSIFKLEDVVPAFGACFTFQELNGPIYQLDVGISPGLFDDSVYEKSHSIWTKPDRRDTSTLLGVYKIQLDGGSSWMLHVLNENTIDKPHITPRMEDFANSVTLKKIPPGPLEPTGGKMFRWKKDFPGAMCPRSFEQKTAYKYRLIHNNDFVFEIARYDVYGSPKNEDRPTHTSWAATLYNREWDSTLAGNAELGIGQPADWDPRLATFFPGRRGSSTDRGPDPGVDDFLSTVDKVTTFADGLKKEAPHLRR